MRLRASTALLAVASLLVVAVPAAADEGQPRFQAAELTTASAVADAVIVEPDADADADADALVQHLQSFEGVQDVERVYGEDVVRVETSAGSAESLAERIADLDGVGSAEVDAPVVATALDPDDPYWGRAYLDASGQREAGWATARAGVPEAWAATTGDADVTIAVLDTGVAAHPDLDGRLLPGRSFVDGEPATGDDHGHGTAVAGVAAAEGDNGHAIAGACWDCSVLPVRVLSSGGSGRFSAVIEGIRWAADQGADVINLSLATAGEQMSGHTLDRLDAAISHARQAGAVVVAAAGNAGTTAESYPAAHPDVVSVGASDHEGARAPFSNHGDWVSLAAGGWAHTLDADGGVTYKQGTSFSAPLVAGALALARAAEPESEPDALVAALTSTADDRWYVGDGELDLAEAMTQLGWQASGISHARHEGGSRYDTAAAISAAHVEHADTAYVATGVDFPDALAAAPAAVAESAPVLLTERSRLPDATADELRRLAPDRIVVLGGTAAVSRDVESSLRALSPVVDRVAGDSRYDTAARLARRASSGSGGTLYLTSGRDFPDALSGGAAAAMRGAPMLLTDPGTLPDATRAALTDLAPDKVVLLGGQAAVSEAVRDEVSAHTGAEVVRRAGAGRYDTSAEISRGAFAEADAVFLATGGNFPDALAAAPVAGGLGAPMLLTERDALPTAAAEELQRLRPDRIVAVGGSQAVDDRVVEAAREAAQG